MDSSFNLKDAVSIAIGWLMVPALFSWLFGEHGLNTMTCADRAQSGALNTRLGKRFAMTLVSYRSIQAARLPWKCCRSNSVGSCH